MQGDRVARETRRHLQRKCPAYFIYSFYTETFFYPRKTYSRKGTSQMAEYGLVDPTSVEIGPSHVICRGQCPRCLVFWSQRPASTCDCFFPGSQGDDARNEWEMKVRQAGRSGYPALSS